MALRKRKGETDAEFKRRQELAAKAEPAGAGRQVAVVEKAGKEFVVPKREERELAATQALGREKVDVELARREGFQKATGSAALTEELQTKILEPPSLAPQPIAEVLSPQDEAQNEILKIAISKAEEIDIIPGVKGKVPLGVKGALAGAVLTLPFVAQKVASASITKSVLGAKGSVPGLSTAIAGLGAFLVGRSVLDFRGDEMDNLRSGLKKVVEDGERIEAANRNGLPTSDSINLLQIMSEEVSNAESRIKQLGNFNVNYRVSKEYILDQQNVRSAREALLRRVLAVENIAATGQAALDPAALMFDVAQFKEGG